MERKRQHATTDDVLALKDAQIFIVGDIILDTYIEGKVSRISPEAPVPVVLETNRRAVPGGAGNVAANVTSVGAVAHLCGRVGNDAEAQILRGVLEDFSIQTDSLMVSQTLPTITKMRVISGNLASSGAQQIVRVDKEITAEITPDEAQRVRERFHNFASLGGHQALVISDYGKGFLTIDLIQSLIQIAKDHHIPVITDPKSPDVSRYQGASVIKPNLNEGRSVLRVLKPGVSYSHFEEEINDIADCYLKESGCHNLVMSLSEHGVMVKGQDVDSDAKKAIRFETQALQVADVSGAGDTLVSFLAMGLACKLPLEKATELGNIAAGLVCGKQGTATVDLSEVLQAFHTYYEATSPDKIVSDKNIAFISKKLRLQDKKIVFTNGCFDLLHAGHVDYLQKAKAMGDILIIGLNADESISRLKGPSRPIQNFDDRSRVLASLACVDFIVKFEEDTPLALIQLIKPHVLVKGSDYTIETTVGAKEVLSWGGAVKHVDLIAGKSTTALIQKIQKNG